MEKSTKLPFYVKAPLLLIGLYVFISILYLLQGIILPIIYATIFAVSISPAVDFLVKKKVNHGLAIGSVLVVAILLMSGLIALLSAQASLLSDAYPQLILKFEKLSNQTIAWFSSYFNVSVSKINAWIADTRSDFMNNSFSAIGVTLTTVSGVLSIAFLIPVYIFMILLYQTHLIEFIRRLFDGDKDDRVGEILTETKSIVQSYLVGLFTEFAIVAALNSLCLMVLGIDYAILFGIIGALLNVIPYIGGIITIFLFMLIAFVTKSPIYALYVFGLYTLIQLIDNNYIVPKIIGSKVKINALICLIAVILGGALWGVPGMFLSIPLTAILKLIFDRIEPLKPWGFLLGDTSPPLVRFTINFEDFSKNMPRMMPPFRRK
jgi:predicted PurR-regulated permease PerM